MQCPYCRIEFYDKPSTWLLGEDAGDEWRIQVSRCLSCERLIVHLVKGKSVLIATPGGNTASDFFKAEQMLLVKPKASSRPPCPVEVPKEIAEDYTEACLVLPDSPKAAAALSRRCLQNLLREAGKATPSDLNKEIQEVLNNKSVPSYIAEDLDAIRHIGNFAAHPTKSQVTGQIVPVETEEVEWTLNVLEALFDFYYVQPALSKKRKDSLNLKLQEAGKKPMQ